MDLGILEVVVVAVALIFFLLIVVDVCLDKMREEGGMFIPLYSTVEWR
jgi:hypothetical protein